jgi:hypothetical protein
MSGSGTKHLVYQLALVLGGAAIGLIAVEIGVRFYEHGREKRALEDWHRVQTFDSAERGRSVSLGEIIRVNPNPEIIYELIPNLSGIVFEGQFLETNGEGFRGPRYPRDLPMGTIRILGIGDSVMFGWGVREEDSYLRVLESMLNEDTLSNARFEVINTAVPGYNTTMEVATLAGKGLVFHPDVVILGFVKNDLELPNFIPRRRNYLSLRRSFLAELLWLRFSSGNARKFKPLVLAPRQETDLGYLDDPKRVPPEHRHMVGAEGLRAAMSRLAEVSMEHGFKVLIFSHRPPPNLLLEIASELRLPIVRADSVVGAYMQERAIETFHGSELTVSETDPHPSAIQHRLLAETLHRHILQMELGNGS